MTAPPLSGDPPQPVSAPAPSSDEIPQPSPRSDGSLPSGDGDFPSLGANPNSISAPPPAAAAVPATVIPPAAPKTYAAATAVKVNRPPPLFVTDLNSFHPTRRGNATFLKMPEELYQKRLTAFNFALLGRIFLPKQAPPRVLPDLKSELQTLFKTTMDWQLTPLGKGFYSLKFASLEDQTLASRFTSWRLKIGNFHVREWKPNFDPYKENTSITQIWVRLFHLPGEYWDPNFLVGIFRAVGNVVKLDGSTAAGTVGHFARALVEVDLSYPLADSVTIECGSSTLVVEFGFENLPLFCSYYRYIGHAVQDCKSRKRAESHKPPNAAAHEAATSAADSSAADPAPLPSHAQKRTWRPKPSFDGISVSNAFESLSEPPIEDISLNPNRSLVPVSPEIAEAIANLKHKDFSSDPLLRESSEAPTNEQQLLPIVAHDNTAMIIYDPDRTRVSDTAADSSAQSFSRTDEVQAPSQTPGVQAFSQPSGGQTSSHPPGVHSTSEVTDESLRALSQRIAALGQNVGAAFVNDKLRQAYAAGSAPSAFTVDPGDSSHIRTMSHIARQRWSETIDEATENDSSLDPRHSSR